MNVYGRLTCLYHVSNELKVTVSPSVTVREHSQVAQPVRALVELRLVCLVLVSRANRWVLPRDAAAGGFGVGVSVEADVVEDLGQVVSIAWERTLRSRLESRASER